MARDLLETDINNRPATKVKAIIIRILTGLEKSIKDIRETDTTDIKNKRKKKTPNLAKMKNAITEIKNQLDVITTKMEKAEE